VCCGRGEDDVAGAERGCQSGRISRSSGQLQRLQAGDLPTTLVRVVGKLDRQARKQPRAQAIVIASEKRERVFQPGDGGLIDVQDGHGASAHCQRRTSK
jgi:hypothetical protein